MLKLMYITNDPEIAKISANAGVDRIFVDMEVLGKAERQGHLDSVKSHHVPQDIRKIRDAIGNKAQILARINPMNPNTKDEVQAAIDNGADIIMLPMWKTAKEVEDFCRFVDARAITMPLLETKEADAALSEVLSLRCADEIYIGLNDLHLSYGQRFMFELLADGTVERLSRQLCEAKMPFGFGGVGRPGGGMLPANYILGEHYRLGSQCVILSRQFCNAALDHDTVRTTLTDGICEVRTKEREFANWDKNDYLENQEKVKQCVQRIVDGMKQQ
ncbi:MAG: aldolase [Ruminococcaceae bacterium]|nr:aldolase [Oscillospiraceae bacterium]